LFLSVAMLSRSSPPIPAKILPAAPATINAPEMGIATITPAGAIRGALLCFCGRIHLDRARYAKIS
jgi:hypothetical protein